MARNQVQHIMDLCAQENLLILEELQVYQDDEYAKGASPSLRSTQQYRSPGVCGALSSRSRGVGRGENPQAGDHHQMASPRGRKLSVVHYRRQ
jgi:hypothetical protein